MQNAYIAFLLFVLFSIHNLSAVSQKEYENRLQYFEESLYRYGTGNRRCYGLCVDDAINRYHLNEIKKDLLKHIPPIKEPCSGGSWDSKNLIFTCKYHQNAVYLYYLHEDNRRYFSHFKHILEYQKEHKECACYWYELSRKAIHINDKAFLLFKELICRTALTTIVFDHKTEELFLKPNHRFQLLSGAPLPELVRSIITHQFLFSHYHHVYCDLTEWAFSHYSTTEAMQVRAGLEDILEELYPMFFRLYTSCLKKHPNPEIERELAFMKMLKRDTWALAESKTTLIADYHPDLSVNEKLMAKGSGKKAHKKKSKEKKSRHKEKPKKGYIRAYSLTPLFSLEKGSCYNGMSLFKEATQVLEEAIQREPKNKKLYAERAFAYFESGNIEKALDDYQKFKKIDGQVRMTKSSFIIYTDFFSIAENSTQFAKGLVKGTLLGCKDSVLEIGPAFIHCTQGLLSGLWSFACSPKQVSQDLIYSAYEVGVYLSSLSKEEKLYLVIPELRDLALNWNTLGYYERGKKIGYITGKYGADVFLLAYTIKGIRLVNQLKNANTMLTLEMCAVSNTNKSIIVEESVFRVAKQKTLIEAGKNGKILIKNTNTAHHIMQRKHMWHHLIESSHNIQDDFKKVLSLLEDHGIVNEKYIAGDSLYFPSSSHPKIVRTTYKKIVNGYEVEAVFERYIESGEVYLQNAWVKTV